MRGQLSFKPGTIALFIFIAIVGYVSYTLVAGNMHDIGDSTSEERDSVMSCSELDIEFIDVDESGNNLNIFFRSNRELPAVVIGFEDYNRTRLVENVGANRIYNATANLSEPSNIYIETEMCEDAYWWR